MGAPVKKPKRSEDYVLLSEYEGGRILLTIDGEPESYHEAAMIQVWVDAMIAEIEFIIKNKTWKLVKKHAGVKPIGLKWIYNIKRNAYETVIKYKAKLVTKNYLQQQGIDFDEVFAPVARIETIRLLLALAATNGWEIHHVDVKTAFLNGELNEDVYVTQPEEFEEKGKENYVDKLSKALYGLRQAPRAWNIKLDKCTQGDGVYEVH